MEKAVARQAHGLTHDEMANLQVHQINETVPMIAANNAGEDQIKDMYFKEKYTDHMIPEVEKNHYHVVAEARLFKSQGSVPEKISTDVLHVFTKEAFKFQMEHGAFNGMDVHILHNPTLNSEENAGPEDVVDLDPELMKRTMADLKQRYLQITGEDMPTRVKNKKDAVLMIQDAIKNKAED